MREIILLLFLSGKVICLEVGPPFTPRQTYPSLDTCQEENMACVIGENLIRSVAEVEDVQLCKQLCGDTEGCTVVSFFGDTSFPFRNYCMLFENCHKLHSCSDCRSMDKRCFSSCSKNMEGAIVNNALEVIPEVNEEPGCLEKCKTNTDCKFYTYYKASDRNHPKLCLLQKHMEQHIQTCDHCKTGTPDCQNTPTCQFFVGDARDAFTEYKFTATTPVNLTIPSSALLSECRLNVVAVGGGAQLNSLFDKNGGGGSGYVVEASVQVQFSSYLVTVGNAQQPSIVKTSTGRTVIEAKPGRRQDGYSGGGTYGNGGHDGGDGGEFGGKGSGLHLSSIAHLKTFGLSAGTGGQKHAVKERWSSNLYGRGGGGGILEDEEVPQITRWSTSLYGGGGGGVLVDGEGPQSSRFAGQGFGGGSSQWSGDAGPGVILVEISAS